MRRPLLTALALGISILCVPVLAGCDGGTDDNGAPPHPSPDPASHPAKDRCDGGSACAPGSSCQTPEALRCGPVSGSVELCREGQWAVSEDCAFGCAGAECLLTRESEAPDQSGDNDHNADADPVALDVDVAGHIGAPGDQDVFRVDIHEVGTLQIDVDFSGPHSAGTVPSMIAVSRHGDADWDTVGVGYSRSDLERCLPGEHRETCPDRFRYVHSVTPEVGRYFIRVAVLDLDPSARNAFDATRPYQLRVHFAPGPDLETDEPGSGGAADTPRTARVLPFDEGRAEVRGYAFFANDYDWFRLDAAADGWLELSLDVRSTDPSAESSGLDIALRLFEETEEGSLRDLGRGLNPRSEPGCPVARLFYPDLVAGRRYFIRLLGFAGSAQHPYRLVARQGAGDPEAEEPSEVGPANSPGAAYSMGALRMGETRAVEGYVFHYLDQDWFRVRLLPGSVGVLSIELDYRTSVEAYGTAKRACTEASAGGVRNWLYVFDQAWASSENPKIADHLALSPDPDDGVHRIQVDVDTERAPEDFFIWVRSQNQPDRVHPYELRVRFDQPR